MIQIMNWFVLRRLVFVLVAVDSDLVVVAVDSDVVVVIVDDVISSLQNGVFRRMKSIWNLRTDGQSRPLIEMRSRI